MIYPVRACMLLVGLLSASIARAECSVSADQGAVARPLSPTVQADADLIVSMSLVPKLTHVDYRSAAHRPACDLGPLPVGDEQYELWGGDVGGRQRKALPARKGQPIALLIPVFDIKKAIDGAKTGRTATIEGYMLATVTRNDLAGWRFYTAMPDVTLLRRDMTEALAGRAKPIFRNEAGGKTSLFIPQS